MHEYTLNEDKMTFSIRYRYFRWFLYPVSDVIIWILFHLLYIYINYYLIRFEIVEIDRKRVHTSKLDERMCEKKFKKRASETTKKKTSKAIDNLRQYKHNKPIIITSVIRVRFVSWFRNTVFIKKNILSHSPNNNNKNNTNSNSSNELFKVANSNRGTLSHVL